MFLDNKEEFETYGTVFNIENYHINDGAGIRTNVFLKGCNLWCQWCCNPESQKLACQVAIHKNLCVVCGVCYTSGVCAQGAISKGEGGAPLVDSAKCVACGACVEKCPNEAIELYGKRMSVAEAIAEVEKDKQYYIQSGGGMTISGGEPCVQPEFARQLARAARRRYIHVAMETAAAVPFEQLWSVAEFVDELLVDVKFTDPEKFKTISGVPLETVKENIRELVRRGKYVKMRCPLIPGLNADEAHIDKLVAWAKELCVEDVDLLPFHQLGKYKYASLGYGYELNELRDMDKAVAQRYRDKMIAAGLCADVGG
ncbi:MAG TPA: glycyl-radical enzyme activating protein [Clostridiales bacterium]|nr:glycyl-radical enzyme activating protein [Clostridiales bacterium]